MLTVWSKVLVKECQPDSIHNSVIYSDNHGNYKWVVWTIIKVVWNDKDKAILDFDHDMIFWEGMLDDMWNEPLWLVPDLANQYIQQEMWRIPQPLENKIQRRDKVIEEMNQYKSILDSITDSELFFKLYHDKLKSLLYEIYWW